MKNITFLLILFLPLLGCNKKEVSINELKYKNGLYIYDNHAFSGHVFSTHDGGWKALDYELKEGIPNGAWTAYGFDGEVIQNGVFNPLSLKQDIALSNYVYRISICQTKEGDYTFNNIYLIYKSKADSVMLSKISKQDILETLKANKIVETGLNDEVKVCDGELAGLLR